MAVGSVNVSNGSGKAEALIEFDNYVSSNLTSDDKIVLEAPVGSKYKFTEHTEEQTFNKSSVLINSPATGYVKYNDGIIFNKPAASILFAATEGENTLHLRNQADGFDCTIDWGDGTTTVAPVDGGPIIHSYETAGDYNIKISGKSFAGFRVSGSDGSEKYKALYSMGEWEVDTMTDISYAFYGCTGLTALPIDLFKYNTSVTNMNSVFYGCTGLIEIPIDLFRYNTLVTDMSNAFGDCTGLTALPADLFKYNTKITMMSSVFYGCSSLTTLPVELFMYNTDVIYASNAFNGCSSLSTLPVDLFKYNTLVTDMSWIFNNCTSLTTLPIDLFRYNTLVTSMSSVFYGCSSLSTLPVDLFKYNTLVTDMSWIFNNCTSLTVRSDIFGEDYSNRFNGKTVDFTKCFFRDEFNGIQGTAPELWNFTGLTSTKTKCFGGAGNNEASLTNYADIPVAWK